MLTLTERLHEVLVASKEMIQPTVFGQIIIITVYLPLLTFTGVEGKMFEPMALTVIFALVAAFVLSLTFVPAMIAHLASPARCRRRRTAHPRAKAGTSRSCVRAFAMTRLRDLGRRRCFRRLAVLVHAARPGVHPDAR